LIVDGMVAAKVASAGVGCLQMANRTEAVTNDNRIESTRPIEGTQGWDGRPCAGRRPRTRSRNLELGEHCDRLRSSSLLELISIELMHELMRVFEARQNTAIS
jgi:hypothetical protein